MRQVQKQDSDALALSYDRYITSSVMYLRS